MKKYTRNVIMAVLLISMTVGCGGCFTALGAIIGYQSGEILAGALIGAGIDAGIGLAEEADRQSENLTIEPEKGRIFAKISCNGVDFTDSIEKAFDGEGWNYILEYKKIRKNQDCEARWGLDDDFGVSIKVQGDKLKLDVKAKNSDNRKKYTEKIAELLKDKFKSSK